MDYRNLIRKSGTILGFAVISSIVTFYVVESRQKQTINELRSEIKTLEAKERQAIVTRRISEQMEDIAFQQKTISDKQREEAERQSQIADMERGKAEIERGLALAASQRAVASAARADSMRVVAERQTTIATENMYYAQQERAKADTLFYRSLGRSLAQTSLKESTVETTELSKLLAYASWHYTSQYKGDAYQQDIYHSLLRASGQDTYENHFAKGAVRGFQISPNMNKMCCFGVTDYGEVIYGNTKKRVIETIDGYCFWDVIALDTFNCVALDISGKVMFYNVKKKYDIKPGTPVTYPMVQLPQDKWTRLLGYDGNKFAVAMGQHHLAWIDMKTRKVFSTLRVENEMTAIGMENGLLHVFAKNADHYICAAPGLSVRSPLTTLKGNVTYYIYDDEKHYHIAGMGDGRVVVINREGRILRTLVGHSGPITHIKKTEKLLATTSYDHTLKFWNLSDLNSLINPFERKYDRWPLAFDINPNSKIICVGMSDGSVNVFGISTVRNSQLITESITRGFTKEEWDYYIGSNVPFDPMFNGK